MTRDQLADGSTGDTPPRRTVLKAGGLGIAAGLGAGAGLGFGAPGAARPTDNTGDVITRPIPKTGERVPAVGLGTFMTFDTLPGADRANLREVLRRHWAGGGRVVDTSALYGGSEANLGDFARHLGIEERLFVANKVWATGEYLWDDSHAAHSLARSQRRLHRRRPIDLMQVHSLVNVDVVVPILHAWKKEGRIRHLGVTHHEAVYFPALAAWIRNGSLDTVQVHYSIAYRAAEQDVLRAAADTGTAVLVNMALEKGRLHKLVAGRPLPAFAAELGITTWAQFFLKWVLGHPAVTVVLPATSRPEHVTDNLGAMRGPLPDTATRARMLDYMATIPGFDRITTTPWYPDRRYPGYVARAQAAVRERSPWWPSGPSA